MDTGEGASVEPSVVSGFLFADLLDAGVCEGLLMAAVLVLLPVFSDCSHYARNAKPIRTANRENRCFFIAYIYVAPRRVSGCHKSNERLEMLAVLSSHP